MDLAQFWFQAAGGGGYQIGNSLRFRSSASAGLKRLPSSWSESFGSYDGTTYPATVSVWVKLGKLGSANQIINAESGSRRGIKFSAAQVILPDALVVAWNDGGSASEWVQTDSRFRDPSAWYHVFVVTSTSGWKIYVNGVEQPTTVNPTLSGTDGFLGNSVGDDLIIGHSPNTSTISFEGYMAEFHLLDNIAASVTDFGEYSDNGVWRPIEYTGSHGTQGFYLDFSDPADIGADRSGNGNDFTATGFELTTTTSPNYDLVSDSPTDNFSTLNPITPVFTTGGVGGSAGSLDANLTEAVSSGASSTGAYVNGNTINIPANNTSQFYFEMTAVSGDGVGGGTGNHGVAFTPSRLINEGTLPSNYFVGIGSVPGIAAYSSGNLLNYGTNDRGAFTALTAYGQTFQVEVDGLNVRVNTQGNLTAGQVVTFTLPSDEAFTIGGIGYKNHNNALNFGQKPFKHSSPKGFKGLSTAELPAVAITNPSDHFQTILGPGPGTGSTTPIGVQYKTSTVPDSPASTYDERVYGKPTTDLGATDGVHPMLEWASRLSLSGYDDWYIPAMHELEILYRNLKPTTDSNYTGSGSNPYAVPPTSSYTASDPAQTTATLFQSGNAQAFATDVVYWTTSQLTNSNPSKAWYHYFLTGVQNANDKTATRYARAIRRVPFTGSEPAIGAAYEGGYFGGLIDAKATPDGTATHALIVAPKEGGEYGVATSILDVAQRTFPNGLWWVKDRANSNQHQLVDSVRGGNLALTCPAFGVQTAYVAPAGNSVAWCWNLLADRSNGFDIVTWAGDGTDNRRIPHGLGAVPEFQIVKCIDSPNPEFLVTYTGVPSGQSLALDLPNALITSHSQGVQAPPDSATTFGTITGGSGRENINQGGLNYVSYLWRSVPGYSSIGSYVGNGNVDGPAIFTGFRPAFIMYKRTDSAGSWIMYDSARATYNPAEGILSAEDPGQEAFNSSFAFDILSNGFKFRGFNTGSINAPGSTNIYMAFAEHPFGGSNVSPAPAR